MVRDSSPKVTIEGPYDTDENLNSFSLDLITADDFSKSSSTDTRRESIFGRDDDESILAPVSGSRSARVSGTTSFSAMDRYFGSSDLKKSVRRYIRSLESLVLPTQGLGWRVEDKVRDSVYDPVSDRGFLITDMSWQFAASSPNQLNWDVEFENADGLQDGLSPEEYIDRRGYEDVGRDRIVVGNTEIEFAEVSDRRVERSVNIRNNDLIHQTEEAQGDSPVLGVIESGIETNVTFGGTIYEPDNFLSTVQAFDTELHGESASLHDELSGTVWEGTITSSDSTINEGEPPNRFDFQIDLQVGDVVTG